MFRDFKYLVQRSFQKMINEQVRLYLTDVDKDEMWNTYLQSFPESRRQYNNCNACKSFIKNYGNVVAIKDNEIVSYWSGIEYPEYTDSAKNLAELVLSKPIRDIFLAPTDKLGLDHNRQQLESGEIIIWEHHYITIPSKFVSDNIATLQGQARDTAHLTKRALTEISDEAINTVLDLINSNTLYRGAEFKKSIIEFKELKRKYSKAKNKELLYWIPNNVGRIKNSAIGTLLVDLSEGRDVEEAVSAFEYIMAPANYKRPNAIITKKMIDEAYNKAKELGIVDSLPRRHASIEDISVNNVLFVNRDARKLMPNNIFESLTETPKSGKYKNVTEILIDDFIKEVLPETTELEVFINNSQLSHLVTLTAPVNKDTPPIFKWNNNFAWTYNGNLADSIREKVKKAGGKVEGVLRCSLHWFNYDDLDIHVIEPNGYEIYFRQKRSNTTGCLDVDMNVGENGSRDAVENIIWTNKDKMLKGEYRLVVHNFCKRETIDVGFECEIECGGKLLQYSYNKPVNHKEHITVAKFKWDGKEVKIISSIDENSISKIVWNIQTNTFIRVTSMMLSPNYWDTEIGNKHYFFMLEECRNPDPVRGIFNEYLKEELSPYKRVFEAIGSKTLSPYTDNQLSGIGFSSTITEELTVRVNKKQIMKIVF